MKLILTICLSFTAILFNQCTVCSCKKVPCPAFNDTSFSRWFPYNTDDKVIFQSTSVSDTISLYVARSEAYEATQGCFGASGGCTPGNCEIYSNELSTSYNRKFQVSIFSGSLKNISFDFYQFNCQATDITDTGLVLMDTSSHSNYYPSFNIRGKNPRMGMKGIFRLSIFKDIAVVSGCGVGGGSLGYANTLYVPPRRSSRTRSGPTSRTGSGGWRRTTRRRSGCSASSSTNNDDPADQLLRELGEELGVGDTYRKTPIGVYLDNPGKTVPDPFFEGEGPERTGCMQCGRCMVGCPHGAKNTLVKNYLWLAEHRGVEVQAERTVTDIRPLGAADGSEGYAVTSERSGLLRGRGRRTLTARGVIVAAGPLGTNKLLQRCRLGGSLPRISPRLGELVRTNSESILGVTGAQGLPRRPDQAGRDHLEHLPRPPHPHRDRHLRRGRRLDEPAQHADWSATAPG